MATIGFLHTSPVHVATFAGLMHELGPQIGVSSVVDEQLLALARRVGPEAPAVRSGVESALGTLILAGADLIVCTCSTIGGVSEVIGRQHGSPVMRADRPMAELAVEIGGRIAVVGALDSTLPPTRDLLHSVASEFGRAMTIDVHVIEGAWERFESGDETGYLDAIADALPGIAETIDVIVLAQASMASATDRADLGIPALSSPRTAVLAANKRLEQD
jgi:hypothetical protein